MLRASDKGFNCGAAADTQAAFLMLMFVHFALDYFALDSTMVKRRTIQNAYRPPDPSDAA